MAASGKKGKPKWKAVPAETVLDQRKNAGNWEDEVAKEYDGNISQTLHLLPKVELPTAPKASRGSVIDDSKIPTIGPFQAYISNIPYDLNEDELREAFQNLKVKNVRLPREEKTSKSKGFGYIEFEDRNSLSAALSLGDTMLKGRPIKIDLPNNSDMRGGNRMRSNRDRDQGSTDRTTGNWRSGPRQDDFQDDRGDRGGYNRGYGEDRRREGGGFGGGGGGGSGYSRGGFDREDRGGGGGGGGGGGFYREDRERFDRGGSGRDDRGGFRERYGERGGGGRDREGGGGFSYNDRGFRERGRDENRYPRTEDRGGGGGGGGGAGSGGGGGSGSWRDDQPARRDEPPPRGGDRDRDRGFGGGSDRDRDRGFGGGSRGFEERGRDRDGGSRFGDRERGGGGFESRRDGGSFEDRRDGGSKFGPPRRDDPPPMDRGGEPRNRPKLQLQPRSKPKEGTPENPSASASIFGGAKPVDTAAREREIEERLMRSEDFSEARGKGGPGSTGSGGREERRERQWEPSEKRSNELPDKRVEPAPAPKENPWARKAPQSIVNNGRSSPEDEGHRSNLDERNQDDVKSKKSAEREKRV